VKGLFPEYSERSSEEYKEAWSKGLFVFDTSVLLNLYRYRAETRDDLLRILDKPAQRIWIPFHVALEFQRNRLKVIATQNNLFSKVSQIIETSRDGLSNRLSELQIKQRHTLIDIEPLTSGFEKLTGDFLAALDKLREKQQQTIGSDPLRDRIEKLFEGRIGSPPQNQKELDEIYKRAETRFKLRIPPGYEDKEKDRDQPDEHIHAGIIYKRKFGDYLIWDQILTYAKSATIKAVIFVTDDRKDDWWWKIDSGGTKTIGPRPELIEEARHLASVNTFLMYGPEGFLKYSNEHLKAKISAGTLNEVRDVSKFNSFKARRLAVPKVSPFYAEISVASWLKLQFEIVEPTWGFPDFVAYKNDVSFGFEVKTVRFASNAARRLAEVIERHQGFLSQNRFARMTLVLVASNESEAKKIDFILRKTTRSPVAENLWVLVGAFKSPVIGEGEFLPFSEFPY